MKVEKLPSFNKERVRIDSYNLLKLECGIWVLILDRRIENLLYDVIELQGGSRSRSVLRTSNENGHNPIPIECRDCSALVLDNSTRRQRVASRLTLSWRVVRPKCGFFVSSAFVRADLLRQ